MNNRIQLVGQVISCTNYATSHIFNFNPTLIKEAAEHFLAAGITEIEIPQGVLDPNNKFPERGLDPDTLKQTINGLPSKTKVIATYLSPKELGIDNSAYMNAQKQVLSDFVEYFPDASYAMLHPADKKFSDRDSIHRIVATFTELAQHATSLRDDFQLCFHNHFDTNGENANQVKMYLDAINEADLPSLRWGPDTGHCHGMGNELLDVLDEYAHLIGNYFHIKARVPAFDQLHGGDEYRQDRDIWNNTAEVGKGLYSGFVNPADPEVKTPFKEIFKIIREKAVSTAGVVRGAMEIDVPRQHPRLEVLCGTLYLKNVHNIESALELSNDAIIERIFAGG